MKRAKGMIYGIGASYMFFAVNMLVNIALIPIMLKSLGNAYYGIWMTVVSVVGYMGILDFGLAFASSKFISEYKVKFDPH